MQLTNTNCNKIVNALNTTQANNTSNINVTTIINALKNVQSTTFATLTTCAKVTLNAHLKNNCNYYKISVQNVTLCNSSASLYSNAVNKQVVQAFTAQQSKYVMLNNSYSVCALISNTNKHYLRATVNKCLQVVYYCATTNSIVSKQHIASYLSAKASAKLLSTNTTTHVQHADVTHNVTVRNFALTNVYSINVAKQSLLA